MSQLTPRQVVSELDKYIIGQDKAKKSVAVALQNRVRRLKLDDFMQKEVKPKNLLMIGPTGVGKTEIARRLATIANAPFVKVEATKYTEVGYVGRDVESMVRDLVEASIRLVTTEQHEKVHDQAEDLAIKRVAKALRPGKKKQKVNRSNDTLTDFMSFFSNPHLNQEETEEEVTEEISRDRKVLYEQIKSGALDQKEITIQLEEKKVQLTQMNPAMEQMMQIQDTLDTMKPKKYIDRTVTVKEAVDLLTVEEADKLVNLEDIQQVALKRAEEFGIIFIDEIDKIAAKAQSAGEVSREGVQRDILPIVEGSQVQTKYGIINTDHILFIGSGAFHIAKPSDLIPELQGRFPLRVELDDLSKNDFVRILTEPKNALIKQYTALLATDGVTIDFSPEAIEKMAEYAVNLNQNTDNIGARRLHTILETVLEDLLFEATDMAMGEIQITEKFVSDQLGPIVEDQDLSHYIL